MEGFCEKCGHLATIDGLCLKHWRALRDKFALAVAKGFMARTTASPLSVANTAYKIADAMLAGRVKGGGA